MSLANTLLSAFYARRLRAIDRFRQHPGEVQHEQLRLLMGYGAETEYFRHYGVSNFDTEAEFRSRIPVVSYDDLQQAIERMRGGEENVLWPGRTEWFACSSGTTADRSKYLPVTPEVLEGCHYRGGRDTLALFAHANRSSKAFTGKTLTLGGSHRVDSLGEGTRTGDLSAIMIQNAPRWANLVREPDLETALLPDFEQKVEAICRRCTDQNITAFAGVPSWNLVLMNRILDFTGKQNLLEIWPDLSLFIHGGVSFLPYREQYHRIVPSEQMRYMETYNASEGFFGLQDDLSRSDMLLMLDYGVYYEFLPLREIDDPAKAVPLEGVATGINYAVIISTCGGLWRYMIGDTVEFTSTDPYRIRITGRTKSYINAFGEELIIDNAERAVAAACQATGAKVTDYTAAPIYMDGTAKGAHEWFVEFDVPPASLQKFVKVLDDTLRQVNSDYAAKRYKNTTLTLPRLTVGERGVFYRWMEQRRKPGGQHKVPRLANDRRYIDQLIGQNRT